MYVRVMCACVLLVGVLLQAEEFCKRGLRPNEVCVLTLYKRQVEIIRWLLRQKKLPGVSNTLTADWPPVTTDTICMTIYKE